jgi:hypothetical protein
MMADHSPMYGKSVFDIFLVEAIRDKLEYLALFRREFFRQNTRGRRGSVVFS